MERKCLLKLRRQLPQRRIFHRHFTYIRLGFVTCPTHDLILTTPKEMMPLVGTMFTAPFRFAGEPSSN